MPPRKNGNQPVKVDTPIMTFDISPNVLALRSSWKWAAVCEYLHKFMPALNVEGYTIQALEDDLADTTFVVLPKLLHRMLYTLTLDRRINTETWEIYLRKQHLRRSLGPYPLGTDEEPIEWTSLTTLAKLDLFHAVCEWPFYNPTRLRTAMNDEDNFANWRAEPIGWDSKRNSYWFIGGERLWIQRARPLPPRPKKTTQKKAVSSKSKKSHNSAPRASSNKKRGRPLKHIKEPAEISAKSSDTGSLITSSRLRKRSAPDDEASSSSKRTRRSTRVSLGTRVSSRLNGGEETEDAWQRVPKEWLVNADTNDEDGDFKAGKGKGKGKGLDSGDDSPAASSEANGNPRIPGFKSSDEESDLTELSDEEPEMEKGENGKDETTNSEPLGSRSSSSNKDEDENITNDSINEEERTSKDNLLSDSKGEESVINPLDDPNFVEWETVCVTIDEWNAFTEQFAKSTSTYEKALYKTITKLILPEVIALFEERKKVVYQIEAVVGRKRSSRLAVIEGERERIRQEENAKMEADAKMDRTRRQEARERAQLAERDAREERRKEREQRLLKEQEEAEEKERQEAEAARRAEELAAARETIANQPQERSTNGRPLRKKAAAARVRMAAAFNGEADGTNEEHWELDCEVCHRKGWNLNDGRKITACEKCSKWQHTDCHDLADDQAGRPRRDWNSVDFLCRSCRAKPNRSRAAQPRTDYLAQGSGNTLTTGVHKGYVATSGQPYSQLPYSAHYTTSNGVASRYSQVQMHAPTLQQQSNIASNVSKPAANQTSSYGKVTMPYATSPYGQYPGYYSQQQPYGSMHAPTASQSYGKSTLPAIHSHPNIAGHPSTPGYLPSPHVPGQGQVAGASRTAYPVAYAHGRSSIPAGQPVTGYWPYGYPGAQQPQAQNSSVHHAPPQQPTSLSSSVTPNPLSHLPNTIASMPRPSNGSTYIPPTGTVSSSPYPTYSVGPALTSGTSVPSLGSIPIGVPAPVMGQYLPPPPG